MHRLMSLAIIGTQSKLVDFSEVGGIHDDNSNHTQWLNGGLLNQTLNKLEPGDTFLIPNKTFNVMGGIQAFDLENVVF